MDSTQSDRAAAQMAWIDAQFDAGRTIYVCTYGHATKCQPKHRNMFKIIGGDVCLQHGKRWDSIAFATLKSTN